MTLPRQLVAATALVLAMLAPRAAVGQYRFITVNVRDATSQAPLPGVDVSVQGLGDRSWTTDAQGTVLVAVARSAKATLQLRRIGYAPVIVTPANGDSTQVQVSMTQAVRTLDTARVVGDARSQMLSGFEQRRSRASGAASYFTAAQIEKMMAIRTIDVVRRAVGTKTIDSSGVLLVASSRGPKTIIGQTSLSGGKGNDLAPCVMRVAVDGMMREWGFSLDGIEPKEVHGVEVYPGPATIPAEFSGMRKDAMCGLVMIWTKRGP